MEISELAVLCCLPSVMDCLASSGTCITCCRKTKGELSQQSSPNKYQISPIFWNTCKYSKYINPNDEYIHYLPLLNLSNICLSQWIPPKHQTSPIHTYIPYIPIQHIKPNTKYHQYKFKHKYINPNSEHIYYLPLLNTTKSKTKGDKCELSVFT